MGNDNDDSGKPRNGETRKAMKEPDHDERMEIINGFPPERKSDIRPAWNRQPRTLTRAEQKLLIQCETIIDRGLKYFIEVGRALTTIKNQRLYRVSPHIQTFTAYLNARWPFGEARARQLMKGVQVVDDVIDVTPVAPTNEAQTRPLAKQDRQTRREAWQRAVEYGKTPTEKTVAKAVAEVVAERYGSQEQSDEGQAQNAQDLTALIRDLISKLESALEWARGVREQPTLPPEGRYRLRMLAGAVRDVLRF